MIALIRLDDYSVAQMWDTPPGRIVLPDNAGEVSPGVVGWEGGGVLTYDENGQALIGPARFKVVEVETSNIPDGKYAVSKSYAYDATLDKVVESVELEDIVVPVPQEVTPRQARLALLAIGKLDEVEAAISQAPRELQITWNYASVIERNDSALLAMADSLGIDEVELDELFELAAKL